MIYYDLATVSSLDSLMFIRAKFGGLSSTFSFDSHIPSRGICYVAIQFTLILVCALPSFISECCMFRSYRPSSSNKIHDLINHKYLCTHVTFNVEFNRGMSCSTAMHILV